MKNSAAISQGKPTSQQQAQKQRSQPTQPSTNMGFVDDSDEHDDFNPIQDLMPPSIQELDQIGKKRAREDDPLRRLLEDPSLVNESTSFPNKRQRITQESEEAPHLKLVAPQVVSSGVVGRLVEPPTADTAGVEVKEVAITTKCQEGDNQQMAVDDPESLSRTKVSPTDQEQGRRDAAPVEVQAETRKADTNSEFSPTHAKGSKNSQAAAAPQSFEQSAKGVNVTMAIDPEEEEEAPKKKKNNKSVRWAAVEDLEQVKYFKMNDEPNKAGLSLAEVQEIQKHLADVPAHLIPSEIQKIEMQLDGRLLRERKSLDSQLRIKLVEMKPQIPYRRPPPRVNRGESFNLGLGEKSNEVSFQKHREADKFRYYAPNPQSQSNPVVELDEFYSKDEKVPKIDLETYAKDHTKEKEGKKFDEDMAQLQKELTCLDEEQKKSIMILLKETTGQSPNVLISLANDAIRQFKEVNEKKKVQMQQMAHQQVVVNQNVLIKPSNFRTVPCRNYHGPNGCTRGEYCHFIHAYGFEGKEIAREVFQTYRNQNIRVNILQEIQKAVPSAVEDLKNANLHVIQQFVAGHNAKIQGINPQIGVGGIGTPHMHLNELIQSGQMSRSHSGFPMNGMPPNGHPQFGGNAAMLQGAGGPFAGQNQQQPVVRMPPQMQQQPGGGQPMHPQQPPRLQQQQQQQPQQQPQQQAQIPFNMQGVPPQQPQQQLMQHLNQSGSMGGVGGGNNSQQMHLNQLLLAQQQHHQQQFAGKGDFGFHQGPPGQQMQQPQQQPQQHAPQGFLVVGGQQQQQPPAVLSKQNSTAPGGAPAFGNNAGVVVPQQPQPQQQQQPPQQDGGMAQQNSVNFQQQAQLMALLNQHQRNGANTNQSHQLLLQQLQNQVNQQQQLQLQQAGAGGAPQTSQQNNNLHQHNNQGPAQVLGQPQAPQNGVHQLLQQLQGLSQAQQQNTSSANYN